MAEENIVTIPRDQHDVQSRSAALLETLLSDPRTAPQAEEIISMVNPEAKFPYRQRREAVLGLVNGELEKERTARKTLEDKITAREAREEAAATAQSEARMVAALEAEKAKRGFSDEMMQRVMDRMRDNNNPDVAAAAAFVAESVPKPPPAQGYDFLPSRVDPFDMDREKDFYDGLMDTGPVGADRWLDKTLRNISRDPEFIRLGNG